MHIPMFIHQIMEIYLPKDCQMYAGEYILVSLGVSISKIVIKTN